LKQLGESYRDFSAKRLEANVAANMERRQKGEQFRVLEAAVPPAERSSPYRGVIILLGLVLGLAIGSGVALLSESADTSFHGASDLQAVLRIPVLAAIPAILLDADRVLLRRRRMRRLWYAAALGGVVLVVAAGGYAYNNGFPFRSRAAPEERAAPSLPAAPAPAPPAEGPNAIPAPAPPAGNNPTPAPAPGVGEGKG
jgi:hypothetical protein